MSPRLPTENFKFPITKEHIIKSRTCDGQYCAVAVAFCEYGIDHLDPELAIHVTADSIWIYDPPTSVHDSNPDDEIKFTTDPKLRKWIRDYDWLSYMINPEERIEKINPIEVQFNVKDQKAKLTKEHTNEHP